MWTTCGVTFESSATLQDPTPDRYTSLTNGILYWHLALVPSALFYSTTAILSVLIVYFDMKFLLISVRPPVVLDALWSTVPS